MQLQCYRMYVYIGVKVLQLYQYFLDLMEIFRNICLSHTPSSVQNVLCHEGLWSSLQGNDEYIRNV